MTLGKLGKTQLRNSAIQELRETDNIVSFVEEYINLIPEEIVNSLFPEENKIYIPDQKVMISSLL